MITWWLVILFNFLYGKVFSISWFFGQFVYDPPELLCRFYAEIIFISNHFL